MEKCVHLPLFTSSGPFDLDRLRFYLPGKSRGMERAHSTENFHWSIDAFHLQQLSINRFLRVNGKQPFSYEPFCTDSRFENFWHILQQRIKNATVQTRDLNWNKENEVKREFAFQVLFLNRLKINCEYYFCCLSLMSTHCQKLWSS